MGKLGKGVGRRMSPQDRRLQVIGVAGRLIAERGYWGVSLHDIAAECGITDAGVLHHFGSKERLLLALLEHRDEADRAALADGLGVGRDRLYESVPTIPLPRLCETMVRRNADQPGIVRLYSVLSAEALEPPHPAHDYFADRERVAVRTFGAALTDDPDDPERRGRTVLAAMDGVQLRWLRDPGRLDLVAEWQVMAARLFR